jgi:hypothetical protein
VYQDAQLSSYSSVGMQQSQVAVELDASSVEAAWFSGDAEILLLSIRGAGGPEFAAVDGNSGSVIWRQRADASVSFVGGDSFLLENGELYDLGTGELAVDSTAQGSDKGKISSAGKPSALSGTKALLTNGEQVVEWDFANGATSDHFGAHSRPVRALELDRSGQHLATSAEQVNVWQLEPEFARSKLVSTAFAGASRNVALFPDGSAFITSGDWVTYTGPSGSISGSEPPAGLGPGCLSAAWAFAPSGEFAAGTEYGSDIVVRNTLDFTRSPRSAPQIVAADSLSRRTERCSPRRAWSCSRPSPGRAVG